MSHECKLTKDSERHDGLEVENYHIDNVRAAIDNANIGNE